MERRVDVGPGQQNSGMMKFGTSVIHTHLYIYPISGLQQVGIGKWLAICPTYSGIAIYSLHF